MGRVRLCSLPTDNFGRADFTQAVSASIWARVASEGRYTIACPVVVFSAARLSDPLSRTASCKPARSVPLNLPPLKFQARRRYRPPRVASLETTQPSAYTSQECNSMSVPRGSSAAKVWFNVKDANPIKSRANFFIELNFGKQAGLPPVSVIHGEATTV